jgi:hypothetical protein
MYVDEIVVASKSAFYSDYAETLVDWCRVFIVKLRSTRKAVPNS